VGWKLAHPKEFGSAFKIGADQLLVFCTTVVVTLATDLLVGIGAGILLKLFLHMFRGVRFPDLFHLKLQTEKSVVRIETPLVFTNFIQLQKVLNSHARSKDLHIDLTSCKFIDHSSMEALHLLQEAFKNEGGHLNMIGLHEFKPLHKSKHHAAARRK
jgi:MFS superfamily sulfate permease-like transporter